MYKFIINISIYILFFASNISAQVNTPIRFDTIENRINKVVFITKDSVYQCYQIISDGGDYYFFDNKKYFEEYLKFQSETGVFYDKNNIKGLGNYRKIFTYTDIVDTIYNYCNLGKLDYIFNDTLLTDSLGYSFLEHDLEIAYILTKMNQIPNTEKYFYSLTYYGQQLMFYHSEIQKSILYKIDIKQDTTFNLYIYQAQSNSFSGMTLTKLDSGIVTLKKMKRIKNCIEQLSNIEESRIFTFNESETNVAIINDKRFVVSVNCGTINSNYCKGFKTVNWYMSVQDMPFWSKLIYEKHLNKQK